MQTEAIVARVQEILLKPKEAWTAIDKEPVNLQDTYVNYVMPLAAIPAVAHFLGMALIGVGAAGEHVRIPFVSGLFQALISFGLSLAMVYVLAYITDWLAPQFGAERNFNQAFKLAAFAPTASWVVGIITLIPALGMFAILGAAYSLYLLYVGLPILMKPQGDKVITYILAVIGCAIVLGLLAGVLLSVFFPLVIPRP